MCLLLSIFVCIRIYNAYVTENRLRFLENLKCMLYNTKNIEELNKLEKLINSSKRICTNKKLLKFWNELYFDCQKFKYKECK